MGYGIGSGEGLLTFSCYVHCVGYEDPAQGLRGIPVGRGAPPNARRAPILLSGAAGTPGTASSHPS